MTYFITIFCSLISSGISVLVLVIPGFYALLIFIFIFALFFIKQEFQEFRSVSRHLILQCVILILSIIGLKEPAMLETEPARIVLLLQSLYLAYYTFYRFTNFYYSNYSVNEIHRDVDVLYEHIHGTLAMRHSNLFRVKLNVIILYVMYVIGTTNDEDLFDIFFGDNTEALSKEKSYKICREITKMNAKVYSILIDNEGSITSLQTKEIALGILSKEEDVLSMHQYDSIRCLHIALMIIRTTLSVITTGVVDINLEKSWALAIKHELDLQKEEIADAAMKVSRAHINLMYLTLLKYKINLLEVDEKLMQEILSHKGQMPRNLPAA